MTTEDKIREVMRRLRERLERHDDSRAAVQAELSRRLGAIRAELEEAEERVNAALEAAYEAEDARLQELLCGIENRGKESKEMAVLVERAEAALLVEQTYALEERTKAEAEAESEAEDVRLGERYGLLVERRFSGIGQKRPREVGVKYDAERGCEVVRFVFLSEEERGALRKMGLEGCVTYKALVAEKRGDEDKDEEEEEDGDDEEEKAMAMDKERGEVVVLGRTGNTPSQSQSQSPSPPPEGEHREEKEGGATAAAVRKTEDGLELRAVLKAGRAYRVRVRAECGDGASEASEAVEFTAGFAECCVWRECPAAADEGVRYAVWEEEDGRVAEKTGDDTFAMRHSTVVGSAVLPTAATAAGARQRQRQQQKRKQRKGGACVVTWGVRVLKSCGGTGGGALGIHVGVAPADVDQCAENFLERGWFLDCHSGTLWAGPPHSTRDRPYGPRKGKGKYVREGDVVGVAVDMGAGTLSFSIGGVCHGAAFAGIPVDVPLVPCVLLGTKGDTVELVGGAAAAEHQAGGLAAPRGLSVVGRTWDTLRLRWDGVAGAAYYQVEAEGCPFWDTVEASAAQTATAAAAEDERRGAVEAVRGGLQPGSEVRVRVRAVCGGGVGPWSAGVSGRTQRAPSAPGCAWRECPGTVAATRRYAVEAASPRVATCACGDEGVGCTVVGSTALPQGGRKVSWGVRVLQSCDDDGYGIRVGVAPADIDQNADGNHERCGWFLDCWSSGLWAGPPHSTRDRPYGPRKGKGKYVREGDVVGVAVDMGAGTLSFSIGGVDLGVAFESIPTDVPLVPCVLLCCEDDSVELVPPAKQ